MADQDYREYKQASVISKLEILRQDQIQVSSSESSKSDLIWSICKLNLQFVQCLGTICCSLIPWDTLRYNR